MREMMEKIPAMPLLGIILAYLAYDYYTFQTDPTSPLLTKQGEVTAAKDEITRLKGRVQQINDFVQQLDFKRSEYRALAARLEQTKAILVESEDQTDLKQKLLKEASSSGLQVKSLMPSNSLQVSEKDKDDFYTVQQFEFKTTGIYFQYLAFLDRIANLQTIIRVEDLSFSANSPSTSKYVELKATMMLKAYSQIKGADLNLRSAAGAKSAAAAGGAAPPAGGAATAPGAPKAGGRP